MHLVGCQVVPHQATDLFFDRALNHEFLCQEGEGDVEVVRGADGGQEVGEEGEATVAGDVGSCVYEHSDYLCDHALDCGGRGLPSRSPWQ